MEAAGSWIGAECFSAVIKILGVNAELEIFSIPVMFISSLLSSSAKESGVMPIRGLLGE
jgi:hypothetical protein